MKKTSFVEVYQVWEMNNMDYEDYHEFVRDSYFSEDEANAACEERAEIIKASQEEWEYDTVEVRKIKVNQTNTTKGSDMVVLDQEVLDNAVNWYKHKEINAYRYGDSVYIILDNEDETHVNIDNNELEYRAECYCDLVDDGLI